MTQIVILAVLLLLVTVGRPWLMLGIARVFGSAIGRAALAKTPDLIHLQPAAAGAWHDAEAAEALCWPLIEHGFEDAGVHTVREMPGVVIRLFASAGESLWAAVYEHPKAGRWVEVYTRYMDGTSATFSTHPPHGLEPRPGDVVVHAPGFSVEDLVARALGERPRRSMKPARSTTAVHEFEQAYADGIAWRKQTGVSGSEVVAIERNRQRQVVRS